MLYLAAESWSLPGRLCIMALRPQVPAQPWAQPAEKAGLRDGRVPATQAVLPMDPRRSPTAKCHRLTPMLTRSSRRQRKSLPRRRSQPDRTAQLLQLRQSPARPGDPAPCGPTLLPTGRIPQRPCIRATGHHDEATVWQTMTVRLHRRRQRIGRLRPGRQASAPTEAATVLVLEAGGHDRRLWINMPIGYGKHLLRRTHQLEVRGRSRTPALNDRRIYFPAGQGRRRLQLDQRDGLLPRPAGRLRRLGGAAATPAGPGPT
jgi:hypothetical protein